MSARLGSRVSAFVVLGAIFFVFFIFWGAIHAFFPPFLTLARAGFGRLARWLRGQARFGPMLGRLDPLRAYLPLLLALAIGTAVIVFAADAFTDLASALQTKSPAVQRIDVGANEWFHGRRSPEATALFVTITTVGGGLGMSVLVAALLVLLVRRGKKRWAVYLAATSLGGALLDQLLKYHYMRARPDMKEALLGAKGYSFPSGHAMGATVILGATAYLAARAIGGWRNKSAVLAAFATLALAIGLSRIYLGVHWVSDVAAGFAAGILWVTATTTGYELFRQYRLVRATRPVTVAPVIESGS